MTTEPVGVTNPQWEFADRIRKVRRDIAGLTQNEMAGALGVSQKVYAAWESNISRPSDIVAIAKKIETIWAADVTASWLLGVEIPAPPPTPTRAPLTTQRGSRARRALIRVPLANAELPTDQSVGESIDLPSAA